MLKKSDIKKLKFCEELKRKYCLGNNFCNQQFSSVEALRTVLTRNTLYTHDTSFEVETKEQSNLVSQEIIKAKYNFRIEHIDMGYEIIIL